MMAPQATFCASRVKAASPIHLPGHGGSAVNWLSFTHLRGGFCTFPSSKSCRQCSLCASCAVCFPVASLHDKPERSHYESLASVPLALPSCTKMRGGRCSDSLDRK